MRFAVSNVCEAFNGLVGRSVVGTKVTNAPGLFSSIEAALATYDQSKDRTPGQHFVVLPDEALKYVSAGVGKRMANEHCYVVRMHRGRVSAYLRREYAASAESLAVVVYTIDAYKADPEVDQAEIDNFPKGTTHVIVAVLASAGPKAPLTPYRFVSNLAGGNNDADKYTIEDVRSMARDIMAYSNDWSVVAD